MTTNLLFQVPDHCGEHFEFVHRGLFLPVRLPIAIGRFLHLDQHGVDDAIGTRDKSIPISLRFFFSKDN